MAEPSHGLKHLGFVKVSYQGIALAMPKVLRYESAFRRCGQSLDFHRGSDGRSAASGKTIYDF
jgi:hypothetical protein